MYFFLKGEFLRAMHNFLLGHYFFHLAPSLMVATFMSLMMKYEPFIPKWNKFQYIAITIKEKYKVCQKADPKSKALSVKGML